MAKSISARRNSSLFPMVEIELSEQKAPYEGQHKNFLADLELQQNRLKMALPGLYLLDFLENLCVKYKTFSFNISDLSTHLEEEILRIEHDDKLMRCSVHPIYLRSLQQMQASLVKQRAKNSFYSFSYNLFPHLKDLRHCYYIADTPVTMAIEDHIEFGRALITAKRGYLTAKDKLVKEQSGLTESAELIKETQQKLLTRFVETIAKYQPSRSATPNPRVNNKKTSAHSTEKPLISSSAISEIKALVKQLFNGLVEFFAAKKAVDSKNINIPTPIL
jgi:hypothetical protein